MKHFLLITNKVKDPEGAYTKKIVTYLEEHGGQVMCEAGEEMALKNGLRAKDVPLGKYSGIECGLVLGGDGTLLRAARYMKGKEIPLIGINLGTLGYLAEVEIANIESALDKLLNDEFKWEERMMLEGQIYKEGEEEETSAEDNYALNDIVISRCGTLQILTLHIYVNGQFLSTYKADGVIISTPTGSTGYNMSAGGPIIEPNARLMLLTPICAHTLNTRSIVLSPDDEVRIEIPQGRDGRLQAVEANFDGSHKVMLQTNDSITVRKAVKTTGILRLNTESFLSVLHKKMNE